MNEACRNAVWLRCDLTEKKGQEFAKQVLDHMRERLSDYQEKYDALFNLEATPAESTAFRFAMHDVKDYPDIITAAQPGGTPYYTNSSHLPVGFTDDIFSALDIQDDLQTRYTSGTVFHAFLGERLPTWESAAALVRKIAENYHLPYFTLSPTYSICPDHGYIAGEHEKCPHCGKTTEVYSRITGYYRPLKNWNDGKCQEFEQRKEYEVLGNQMDLGTNKGACATDVMQMSKNEAIRTIAANIKIDDHNLEPTDTEGHTIEGAVSYNGREFFVHMSVEDDRCQSWEEDAAEQIYDQLSKETGKQGTLSTADNTASDAELILVARKDNCAKCEMSKRVLDDCKLNYRIAYVEDNDGIHLAAQYGLSEAGALIVKTGDKAEVFRNASEIIGWINASNLAAAVKEAAK